MHEAQGESNWFPDVQETGVYPFEALIQGKSSGALMVLSLLDHVVAIMASWLIEEKCSNYKAPGSRYLRVWRARR